MLFHIFFHCSHIKEINTILFSFQQLSSNNSCLAKCALSLKLQNEQISKKIFVDYKARLKKFHKHISNPFWIIHLGFLKL
jgi:hypothetical protein